MKRRLLTITMFLLLGAILNIAVAWGCAISVCVMPFYGETNGYNDPTKGIWRMVHLNEKTGSLGVAFRRVPLDISSEDTTLIEQYGIMSLLPAWAVRRAMGSDAAWWIAEARGWPCHALYAEFDFGSLTNEMIPIKALQNRRYDVICAINTKYRWKSDRLWPCVLPLHPLLPGFAINTIFYAAIMWLLFAAPFALRRWRRIKRGLCPACAYPVGGSDVCTECGKAVKVKVDARTMNT